MEEYFTKVRELETKLEKLDISGGGHCKKPTDPGADPTFGRDYGADASWNPNAGYSNEALRADAMTQLAAMAFRCDVARHGTLRITFGQCRMNVQPLGGYGATYHELSHAAGKFSDLVKVTAWNVDVYCKLVNELKNTPEGAGTLLDNSAILFLNEGGWGTDVENGRGTNAHSGENMSALIAGGGGGSLKQGLHVNGNKAHPTSVIITGMKASGYNGNKLEEVTGSIDNLFI